MYIVYRIWHDHHHRCQEDIHSNTRSLHPRPLVCSRFCVFYSFYLLALQFAKWINVYCIWQDHHHLCQGDIHSNTRSLHPRPGERPAAKIIFLPLIRNHQRTLICSWPPLHCICITFVNRLYCLSYINVYIQHNFMTTYAYY